MTTGLSLISIGLSDEKDLSLRGLEEARRCDSLYAELYTTVLDTDVERLSSLIGNPIKPIDRDRLEESSNALLEEAAQRRVGLLVGGDCLSATTHISLLLDARRRGIQTNIVHGSSVLTAVAEAGLSLYKFGRTVTLPLPEKGQVDTVFNVLEENNEHGLHTLILLDLDTETGCYLTINRAISLLLENEGNGVFNTGTLVVGVARIGWEKSLIKATSAVDLMEYNFGGLPHALIVPGHLHFLEAQALRIIAECPQEAFEGRRTEGEIERLIKKYIGSCRKALNGLRVTGLHNKITDEEIKILIEQADRYLKDAEYYTLERKAAALASVSYAEGILDALKLLSLVEFEW